MIDNKPLRQNKATRYKASKCQQNVEVPGDHRFRGNTKKNVQILTLKYQ